MAGNSIAHRVSIGRLHRIHHGVYLLDEPGAASRVTLFTAAVAACGEGAILSHLSAAELWGLLKPALDDIHVTVIGRNAGARREGVRLHRATRLDPRDIRVRREIRGARRASRARP